MKYQVPRLKTHQIQTRNQSRNMGMDSLGIAEGRKSVSDSKSGLEKLDSGNSVFLFTILFQGHLGLLKDVTSFIWHVPAPLSLCFCHGKTSGPPPSNLEPPLPPA